MYLFLFYLIYYFYFLDICFFVKERARDDVDLNKKGNEEDVGGV